jgi:Zn-finger nucleic acid-binding protein
VQAIAEEEETEVECPIDGSELRITERGGVEVDYCPKCRGVWLDRGELDKIIDRAGAFDAPYEYARQHSSHEKSYPKKKPKNFLKDFFEFGE